MSNDSESSEQKEDNPENPVTWTDDQINGLASVIVDQMIEWRDKYGMNLKQMRQYIDGEIELPDLSKADQEEG